VRKFKNFIKTADHNKTLMSSIVTHLKRQEVQPQLRHESAILAPC